MTNRKKKIFFTQIILLFVGLFIIFFTYLDRERTSGEKLITASQEKVKQQLEKQSDGDVFYNIEYSGIDLTGNRYILKSKEATTNKSDQDIVNMKFVTATFYFKDGTVLTVSSKTGIYNNKSLDMFFYGNVKADYMESKLSAEKAEYSNTESFLVISKDVIIEDTRGKMAADKLFFDIEKQTLKIAAFNDNKVNANINLKWKKDLEF